MARIFTDGAEIGDTSFWTSLTIYNSSNVTVTTDQERSGAYSYRSNYNNGFYKAFSPLSEFYLRVGLRTSIVTASAIRFPRWMTGLTDLGSLRVNGVTGKIEAYRSSTTFAASGSIPLLPNTWYLIELHVVFADAGAIQVKVDGVMDIDYSGDTKPGTDTTINTLFFNSGGGTTDYIWLDDLAMNDTTGVVDNSWCGDGKVLLLKPNAAGDVTQLTPSAGANYECVDDIPSDDDTSYVSSFTTDQYDLYNLESFTPTGVAISRVWATSKARKSQADTRKLKLILKTHTTEYDGSGDSDLLTTHTQVNGTEQLVNPNTSVAWTISELDDLQVGVKVR